MRAPRARSEGGRTRSQGPYDLAASPIGVPLNSVQPAVESAMGRPMHVALEERPAATFRRDPDAEAPNRIPNILVTGTPGTGKTSTCALLASATGLNHVNVSDLVREKGLHEGWDETYQSFVLDEERVCDELEGRMAVGGNIVDHHTCDFFPERWFDLVVVLQTDNAVLYERLTDRGYLGRKLEENMECEIMQVLLEDAHESYRPEIVMPLPSNTPQDQASNVAAIRRWFMERNQ
eukprot:TRINITY_DN7292_c0_g1_i1.p1 TRINITY_DN7292_c0_g1~~TRINITY_DN7292_c0_g1_i1.p1  ORF type:complete len:235 (-),score=28.73 TRINITY_DN7292_c0_g1_i1:690-1394(-)